MTRRNGQWKTTRRVKTRWLSFHFKMVQMSAAHGWGPLESTWALAGQPGRRKECALLEHFEAAATASGFMQQDSFLVGVSSRTKLWMISAYSSILIESCTKSGRPILLDFLQLALLSPSPVSFSPLSSLARVAYRVPNFSSPEREIVIFPCHGHPVANFEIRASFPSFLCTCTRSNPLVSAGMRLTISLMSVNLSSPQPSTGPEETSVCDPIRRFALPSRPAWTRLPSLERYLRHSLLFDLHNKRHEVGAETWEVGMQTTLSDGRRLWTW
ncbi:hypothetical protein R3P38DRAFT_1104436 [Favolaschia claudopus]|uniref:Uncharacterized protein n=1 Tax=Favolaschia claudopus TaxID=2862362 RepID=A0AAW0BDK4_9AGAR